MRHGHSTTPGPAQHATSYSRIRWWAATYLVTMTALVGAIASLLAGEPTGATLALLAVTVVAGTGGIRARQEFRRGWRRGYESAIRTMLEHQAGRTPYVEVRATVTGDPTPEPWDVHPPVTRVRSAS